VVSILFAYFLVGALGGLVWIFKDHSKDIIINYGGRRSIRFNQIPLRDSPATGLLPIADHDIWLTQVSLTSSSPLAHHSRDLVNARK
jgi:hypothetical protein